MCFLVTTTDRVSVSETPEWADRHHRCLRDTKVHGDLAVVSLVTTDEFQFVAKVYRLVLWSVFMSQCVFPGRYSIPFLAKERLERWISGTRCLVVSVVKVLFVEGTSVND